MDLLDVLAICEPVIADHHRGAGLPGDAQVLAGALHAVVRDLLAGQVAGRDLRQNLVKIADGARREALNEDLLLNTELLK